MFMYTTTLLFTFYTTKSVYVIKIQDIYIDFVIKDRHIRCNNSIFNMSAFASLLPSIGIHEHDLDGIQCYTVDHKAQFGVAVGLVGLATYSVYRQFKRKYRLPPGPGTWPVVGNIIELMKSKRIWELLANWKQKYGDIYVIYFGSSPTVVLNSMDIVREAYIHQGAEYAYRPKSHTFDLFTFNGKDIVFDQYTKKLQLKRKIAMAAIRQYSQGQHLNSVVAHSMEKVVDLIKQKDGHPFDPQNMTKLLVYNIIGVTCFGIKYDLDDPFLEELQRVNIEFEETIGLGLMADFFPFFKYIQTPATKFLIKARDWFLAYVSEQLQKHRENFDPNNVTDFTSHLIAKQKEAEENPDDRSVMAEMDDIEICMIIMDIFSAGIDTTRITLHWVMAYMAANPEVQIKIQQELDQVLSDNPMTVADKDSLHYTSAVIHEVMRIRPIVFMGVPHATQVDTKLNGYDIPAGTQVFTNVWSIHHEEKHWENPTEFKPERWLDESGKFLFQQKGYLPFSLGRRNCVGESLAKVDILMSVASLFQVMSLEYVGSGQIDLEPKMSANVIEPQPFDVVVKMRK